LCECRIMRAMAKREETYARRTVGRLVDPSLLARRHWPRGAASGVGHLGRRDLCAWGQLAACTRRAQSGIGGGYGAADGPCCWRFLVSCANGMAAQFSCTRGRGGHLYRLISSLNGRAPRLLHGDPSLAYLRTPIDHRLGVLC